VSEELKEQYNREVNGIAAISHFSTEGIRAYVIALEAEIAALDHKYITDMMQARVDVEELEAEIERLKGEVIDSGFVIERERGRVIFGTNADTELGAWENCHALHTSDPDREDWIDRLKAQGYRAIEVSIVKRRVG
jgi:hypothetical protein